MEHIIQYAQRLLPVYVDVTQPFLFLITQLFQDSDDFVCSLVDLDLSSLTVILGIKSDQEEIGDFSFSFNQTDIALAVVQWVKYDLDNRWRVRFQSCWIKKQG